PPTLPTLTPPTVSLPARVCSKGGLPCKQIRRCLAHPRVTGCAKVVKTVCRRLPGSALCQQLTGKLCSVGSLLGLCNTTAPPATTPPTSSGPLDPICTLAPLLCRPPGDYPTRRIGGYDKDLAMLLLQGVGR
ncbi:MAG: hypothetical protein ACRDPG_12590, partial [Nocardioidaceae bacterium]